MRFVNFKRFPSGARRKKSLDEKVRRGYHKNGGELRAIFSAHRKTAINYFKEQYLWLTDLS